MPRLSVSPTPCDFVLIGITIFAREFKLHKERLHSESESEYTEEEITSITQVTNNKICSSHSSSSGLHRGVSSSLCSRNMTDEIGSSGSNGSSSKECSNPRSSSSCTSVINRMWPGNPGEEIQIAHTDLKHPGFMFPRDLLFGCAVLCFPVSQFCNVGSSFTMLAQVLQCWLKCY